MIASTILEERRRFLLYSRENISAPKAATTTPNSTLTALASTCLSKNAPGMLPASTSAASGRYTFGSRLLRFFHVRIRLVG